MAASWLAIPDMLSVSLNYSHAFGGTTKTYDISGSLPPSEARDMTADTVSLNFRFQL